VIETNAKGADLGINPGVSNVIALAAGYDCDMALSLPLQVSSITASGLQPVIGFRTFLGQNYTIQYSPTPGTAGSWSDMPGGYTAGNGLNVQITDTNAAVGEARFYRLKKMP